MRPAWTPTPEIIQHANITSFMAELGLNDVKIFHRYTVEQYEDFWQRVIKKLHLVFKKPPELICDLSQGVASPSWFKGALLNIAESCFTAPCSSIAIIYEDKNKNIVTMTFEELNQLSNRIATSLLNKGFKAGDPLAIAMPMDAFAVAIYLGIIKMGGVVVSIADSFSSQEIAVRLNIAKAKAIFTQNYIQRGGKTHSLYEKVQQANAPCVIVLPSSQEKSDLFTLRTGDLHWKDFLCKTTTPFEAVPCEPMAATNILFSSGTTAEPKAIVWNHTTPVKAASDAFFHQNIQTNDVLAWPTNLGWMMGPWLIYAAFINRAAIALYTDIPKDRAFGEFIVRAKVTMLGVVPTLVAAWRQTRCMEQLDWSAIKVFSSTGECSNPEDMAYLMSQGVHKPIIEYCGGTEIGGAYVSSTIVQTNIPSQFSTPTMGSDFIIIDEHGKPRTEGEVALIPPALGLSTQLLNADHYQTYFSNMPLSPEGKTLRRHGDQIKQLQNNYYVILGRVDDTMNLGGIKISAAEIERALTGLPSIVEVAAIAIAPPTNGPSLLVIYAATSESLSKNEVMKDMQDRINKHINPLFKIHDVVFVRELPKTASNKIMRRVLRKK